ncbi:MAG: acyl-CoA dehydrogenase family protein, partial [Candidatus Binatia bacterium]
MPSPSLDYFDVESQLSSDERMVRDTARQFVEEEYLPTVQDAFRRGYFPRDVIPKVAELGFLGSNLPEKYGCAGLNN